MFCFRIGKRGLKIILHAIDIGKEIEHTQEIMKRDKEKKEHLKI